MPKFEFEDLIKLEKYYKIALINKIAGLKSANLIGTKSNTGKSNLAIFNSVVHIGAAPPLMGFILRPLAVDRHTYSNIKEQGHFTINQVTTAIHQKAHQTSAKYDKGVSEFQECGLKEIYIDDFPVPFVVESNIQIGLSFQEEHLIAANHTRLIIGRIEKLILPDEVIKADGDIDLEALDTAAIGGLDTYYAAKRIGRYAYARGNEEVKKLD